MCTKPREPIYKSHTSVDQIIQQTACCQYDFWRKFGLYMMLLLPLCLPTLVFALPHTIPEAGLQEHILQIQQIHTSSFQKKQPQWRPTRKPLATYVATCRKATLCISKMEQHSNVCHATTSTAADTISIIKQFVIIDRPWRSGQHGRRRRKKSWLEERVIKAVTTERQVRLLTPLQLPLCWRTSPRRHKLLYRPRQATLPLKLHRLRTNP